MSGGANRSMPLTPNPGMTGFNSAGWYMRVYRGMPATWSIEYVQMNRGEFLVLAAPYPMGTTFDVHVTEQWAWPAPFDHIIQRTMSLEDVFASEATIASPDTFDCPDWNEGDRLCTGTSSPGALYYVDEDGDTVNGKFAVLYLRVVNLNFYDSQLRFSANEYERGGVGKQHPSNQFVWHVNAACPAGATFTEPGRTGEGITPGSEVDAVVFCNPGPIEEDEIPHPMLSCSTNESCGAWAVCGPWGDCDECTSNEHCDAGGECERGQCVFAAPPTCRAPDSAAPPHLFKYNPGDGPAMLATDDCQLFLSAEQCAAVETVEVGGPGTAAYRKYWLLRPFEASSGMKQCQVGQ